MTPEELKRLRELCERATPGPWTTFGAWGGQGAGIAIGENPDHWVVFGKITEEPHISNSFLCAAAREDLPKLLDEVEADPYVSKARHMEVIIECDSLKAEVESLKQEVNGLSENLYISNEAAVNAERERDSLKAEVETIRTKWRACADAIGGVNARAFHLERERDRALARVEKLEKACKFVLVDYITAGNEYIITDDSINGLREALTQDDKESVNKYKAEVYRVLDSIDLGDDKEAGNDT